MMRRKNPERGSLGVSERGVGISAGWSTAVPSGAFHSTAHAALLHCSDVLFWSQGNLGYSTGQQLRFRLVLQFTGNARG